MRTSQIGALLALTLALSLGSGAALAAPASGPATVRTAAVGGLGTVLVNGGGLTLYRFTADKKGASSCNGGCASAWPPLLVSSGAKPTASGGASATKLGTIKRANGQLQVTYGGYPLYRFASDTKAGEAKGEAVAGSWFAIAASGVLVRTEASGVAATTSSPATTSPAATTTTTTPSATTPAATTPAPPAGGGTSAPYNY